MAGYFSWLPRENNSNLFADNIKKKLTDYKTDQILFNLLKNIPLEDLDLNKILYREMKTFFDGS